MYNNHHHGNLQEIVPCANFCCCHLQFKTLVWFCPSFSFSFCTTTVTEAVNEVSGLSYTEASGSRSSGSEGHCVLGDLTSKEHIGNL